MTLDFSHAPLPLSILWLLLFWIILSLASWLNVRQFRKRIPRWDRRFSQLEPNSPPAAVIIPIKNVDPQFTHHIDALLTQDYPQYRLIFVVESESDPAHTAIQSHLASTSTKTPTTLLIAGQAQNQGQKVHNLLSGVKNLTPDDTIVVFADADAIPDDQWLTRLAKPLNQEYAAATTGYRWLIPADSHKNSIPTAFASILNASVATLLGHDTRTHAWGGSTALLQSTLHEVDLPQAWQGSLSDDYQFTSAVKTTKKRILFLPRCLVASPVQHTFRSLFEFARRQYLVTWNYAPLLWWLPFLTTGLYTAGFISALLAIILQIPGWSWALVALLTVFTTDFLRANTRKAVITDLYSDTHLPNLKLTFFLERFATPLWMMFHFLTVAAAFAGRTITWAKITYKIKSPQNLTITHRQ